MYVTNTESGEVGELINFTTVNNYIVAIVKTGEVFKAWQIHSIQEKELYNERRTNGSISGLSTDVGSAAGSSDSATTRQASGTVKTKKK